MAIESYPLTWPSGWKRTPATERKYGQFNKKETEYYNTWDNKRSSRSVTKNLSVADGVSRILESLEKMGIERQDVIISTNVRTRMDGMPRSGEKEPTDPGAAVYWQAKIGQPMRCMAINRYTVVADNLAAIAATLEAMRAIERHGGAEILDRAFTGFKALAAEAAVPDWWDVLDVPATATADQIEAAYRREAKNAHPDAPGGSHDAMTALNTARDRALDAVRSRG